MEDLSFSMTSLGFDCTRVQFKLSHRFPGQSLLTRPLTIMDDHGKRHPRHGRHLGLRAVSLQQMPLAFFRRPWNTGVLEGVARGKFRPCAAQCGVELVGSESLARRLGAEDAVGTLPDRDG